MSLRDFPAMAAEQARLMNPLQLAHVGDTVWDLLVRSRLLYQGRNVHNMHQGAVQAVNAHAQRLALEAITPLLTEAEGDIVRRGRNVHAHHAAPKNQEPADYAASTALEALMGYLYLTGQDERILALFHHVLQQTEDEKACRK